ncbi:uncharacterized protein LOC118493691 isoform X2 [Sander lucioperca]|uniref:uncharacterized protein LOC118493691 isoform X2 n=1 Tax=Sander lucioperca TaxID=283035 RepID=UPI001653BFE7|nr:uncharacterized protein LOC118493691 isoform X2 [Sander lucioperca]
MSPSPTVPTSVDYVRAADVKVITALGDSLTHWRIWNLSQCHHTGKYFQTLQSQTAGSIPGEDLPRSANHGQRDRLQLRRHRPQHAVRLRWTLTHNSLD